MSTEFVTKIKELRAITHAGLKDCRDAIKECNGDIKSSIEYLKVKGLLKAEQKLARGGVEGLIYSYIHPGNRVGVLLELSCETDFVSKNSNFSNLAHNIAMHIASAKPKYIDRTHVSAETISDCESLFREQAITAGIPEKRLEQAIKGKLDKYLAAVCLMEQSFIRDDTVTISELIKLNIVTFGENITLKRFSVFVLGEID